MCLRARLLADSLVISFRFKLFDAHVVNIHTNAVFPVHRCSQLQRKHSVTMAAATGATEVEDLAALVGIEILPDSSNEAVSSRTDLLHDSPDIKDSFVTDGKEV